MQPTPDAATKLDADPALDAALARLGAQAVGAPLLLCIVALLAVGRAQPAQATAALMAAAAAAGLVAWWGSVLVRVRRTVASALRFEGQPLQYRGTVATLLQPRANASILHAALFLAAAAAAFAGNAGPWLGMLLRPLLGPFGEYLGLRHRLRHTRYAGHGFDLVGPFAPYLRLGVLQWVLGVVSFGVLWGRYAVRKRRYLFAQLRWAGHAARYDGDEAEAQRLYLRGIGLCVVTLGIYLPWHLVALRNYHLSRISLAGVRLVCAQQGRSYLSVSSVNFLANLFTLGLASGWSWARQLRYQLDHLHFVGALQAPLAGASTSDDLDGDSHDGLSDLLSGALTFEC